MKRFYNREKKQKNIFFSTYYPIIYALVYETYYLLLGLNFVKKDKPLEDCR